MTKTDLQIRHYRRAMKKELTHQWNVTPKEAIQIQKELRSHISIRSYEGKVTHIAGADISLNMFSDIAYAGIIVMSFPDCIPVAHAVLKKKISFPYIPGLLSFREIPALVEVWELLKKKTDKKLLPDIIVVDGQGIAHPRSMGIATHLGMIIDMPTIGSAKSPLYGIYDEPSEVPGALEYIHDKYDREKIIGAALRTKQRSKPIIISPGNDINLEQSINILKTCVKGYRIPEPTRLAHELVNDFRKGTIDA